MCSRCFLGVNGIRKIEGLENVREIEDQGLAGLGDKHSNSNSDLRLKFSNRLRKIDTNNRIINPESESIKSIDFSECTLLTKIPQDAFRHINNIEDIKLPSSIKKIGARAFYGLAKLRTLEIPPDVMLEEASLAELRTDNLVIHPGVTFGYNDMLSGNDKCFRVLKSLYIFNTDNFISWKMSEIDIFIEYAVDWECMIYLPNVDKHHPLGKYFDYFGSGLYMRRRKIEYISYEKFKELKENGILRL